MRSHAPEHLSLDHALTDFAWKSYLKFLGSPKRHFVNKNKHIFTFNESLITLDHETQVTGNQNECNLLDSINCVDDEETFPGEITDSYLSADSDLSEPWMIYSHQFIGQSDKKRTINVEKSVPVTIMAEVFSSFSLGGATNIDVSLPSSALPSNMADLSITVTRENKQECHQSTPWKKQVTISNRLKHKTEVTWYLHEIEVDSNFKVTSKLSLSEDCLPVIVRRKSDNKTVYVCLISNLEEVFQAYVGENVFVSQDGVLLTSQGRCRVSSWGNDELVVKSEDIVELRETTV